MSERTSVGRPPKTPLAHSAPPLSGASRRAWTDAMAVRPFGDAYLVNAADGTYVVSLAAGRCCCEADARCVHRRRVAIEINLGRVPPPEGRCVPCRDCGDAVGVSVADDPPHLSDCTLEPGDLVVDIAGDDVPLLVASIPGPPASAVQVPDANCSVAEYPVNETFPDDAPVVEAVYPLSVTTDRQPRRYRFPVSRLERPASARGTPPITGHRCQSRMPSLLSE